MRRGCVPSQITGQANNLNAQAPHRFGEVLVVIYKNEIFPLHFPAVEVGRLFLRELINAVAHKA